MCGIVGYVGKSPAVPVLIEGLKRLEYRGYDSSGVVTLEEDGLEVRKSEGRISRLEGIIARDQPLKGTAGAAHTRWATHGRPCDDNAHPHTDCTGKVAVVHNGIIENYVSLRKELSSKGHVFKSETDTEVLPHLIEDALEQTGDFERAVRIALDRVEGSYAIVVMNQDYPDTLIAARKDSPLVLGIRDGESFVASDVPALLPFTNEVVVLNDGEMAVIVDGRVEISMTSTGEVMHKDPVTVDWTPVMAEKGGYDHFMLKEIHEQPKAVRDTIGGRIAADDFSVTLGDADLDASYLKSVRKIFIVACGTAYHAGMVGKRVIEKLTSIPVEVDIASEFRYRDPIMDERTLTIVISQSGETADTLAGLREAKRKGSRVLAITNVVGSSVAREADKVVYTWAGPEIAVASTKAYMTQLVALYLLGLHLGQRLGTIAPEDSRKIVEALKRLPEQVKEVLETENWVRSLAYEIRDREDVFFIGRGLDYAVSLEGALKLKEISYIHAEAYAAGELKHGTLALITEGVPVFALSTQASLRDKMLSNIKEVKARGAEVIGICISGDELVAGAVDRIIEIPQTIEFVVPVLSVIPLQLFAYYAAVARGCDVDKPRNLAKSVTVE